MTWLGRILRDTKIKSFQKTPERRGDALIKIVGVFHYGGLLRRTLLVVCLRFLYFITVARNGLAGNCGNYGKAYSESTENLSGKY
jgi:hypothetical protein